MMTRHGENQIGLLDELPGEQASAMAGEIESPFQTDEVGAFRCGRAVPRPGARRRDVHVEPSLLEGALQQHGRERAAADIACADEQDLLSHGARRPTARRNS